MQIEDRLSLHYLLCPWLLCPLLPSQSIQHTHTHTERKRTQTVIIIIIIIMDIYIRDTNERKGEK